MQIKIKGNPTVAELLVTFQMALAALQDHGRGEITGFKGVSLYLTPINSKGEQAPLIDPATGKRMKDDRDNKAVLTVDAYKGLTAEDTDQT